MLTKKTKWTMVSILALNGLCVLGCEDEETDDDQAEVEKGSATAEKTGTNRLALVIKQKVVE